MRTGYLCLAVAASLLLIPGQSRGDDVEEQLRVMQERMAQMEERLQATSDQLEASSAVVERQQELIERSGIADDRAVASGLASFLETLEIGGWISGSYIYNAQNADGRDQGGFNTGAVPAYPFKPDTNTFQLDQLWFELERPVSEEHRAGFRADLVFGKTADLLSDGVEDGLSGSDQDFELYQAYIQYLAPLGDGVHFKFGKFATLIGAEVAQAPYNFNITRGNVYNLFQPINNVGILASGEMAEDYTWALGFVNETRSDTDVDLNKNKAVIWSLGWSGDTVAASFNGTYGASDSGQGVDTRASQKETIYDLILSWDPNEKLSTYINADYISSDNNNPAAFGTFTGEFDGYGIAVAGRYAINERLGAALRGEWVDLSFDRQSASDQDMQIWDITGTLDYSLTDQLMVRGELRYDVARQGDFNNVFFDSRSSTRGVPGSGLRLIEDDQFTGAVEVIYNF